MAVGETSGKAINPMLFLEIFGALLVGGIVYAVLKKFHIIGSSAADKVHELQEQQNATDAAELDTNSGLKQITWTNFIHTGVGPAELKNQNPIAPANMADLAIQIYNAKGAFHDTESTAIGAVNSMPNKVSVAVLASAFNSAYGRDLLEYMKTFMNDAQLASVSRSINSKPDFSPFLKDTTAWLKKTKQTLTLS